MTAITQNKKLNTLAFIVAISLLMSLLFTFVNAVPDGPSIVIVSNTTRATLNGTLVNSTVNTSAGVNLFPGGYIFTSRLTSTSQNTRWKGYVGNVTGTLTLDDASSNTLYQWALTSITGEVYATRGTGTINWSGVNCTWIGSGNYSGSAAESSNRTIETLENAALSHTGKDDNISATFSFRNHSSISVGSVTIGKNECFSAVLYQKDAAQVFTDSNNANYSEVLLYDAALNKTNGNVIYTTKIDTSGATQGFDNGVYNFQLILPENGAAGFSGVTSYMFYVELT